MWKLMDKDVKTMFAILDCECIQTTRHHCCIRKMFILSENGLEKKEQDFTPCIKFNHLEEKYKRAFKYCKRKIHKLTYNPEHYYPCILSVNVIDNFIKMNNINLVLYKGGSLEKNICENIGIKSLNLEDVGVPKASSHQPKEEVFEHLKYIQENCLLEKIKKH